LASTLPAFNSQLHGATLLGLTVEKETQVCHHVLDILSEVISYNAELLPHLAPDIIDVTLDEDQHCMGVLGFHFV